MHRRNPFTDHLLSRRILQVLDGTLEELNVVSGVTQDVSITRKAKKSTAEAGVVIVVDAELLLGAGGTLADGALAALQLVDRLVFLGGHAVGFDDPLLMCSRFASG